MRHGRRNASCGWCVGLLLSVTPVLAQTNWPLLGEGERAAVVAALDALNMTTNDPGFMKDVAEPRWVLQRVRTLLHEPLALPTLGCEAVQVAEGNRAAERDAIPRWLEIPWPAGDAVAASVLTRPDPNVPVDVAVQRFVDAIRPAVLAPVAQAFADIPADDRAYAAATLLGGTFLIDDHPELRGAFAEAGIAAGVVDAVLAEDALLNPVPGAARYLGVCTNTRLDALWGAMGELQDAVQALEAACAGAAWPDSMQVINTAEGRIVVGTPGADTYAGAALLILDPGGNDLYRGDAGSANGLVGRGVSVVVDLGGDDRYEGDGLLAPGAALFGVALVLDRGGADTHRAVLAGAGAGLFGVARVEDVAGDDAYQALALGQGAGVAGVGILRDEAGHDRYDLGHSGQGFSGVRGVGLLMDRAGNDRYAAGGHLVDWDRNEGRFLSLAQGFASGMRPFAGGGVAALVDLDGNDTYEADVYGQGVGYWYAVGMLLDRRGEDTYQLFQYGQGSGIHLSLGLLADGGGRDVYSGYILSQGNAHDYAVGLLLDHDGNDTYTGDSHTQGRAINNGFALLLDSAGDDAYFARQPEQAQGIGDNGFDREYGSLALVLDLAGVDRYGCGATDGARLARPDFGIVYDVMESTHAPAK